MMAFTPTPRQRDALDFIAGYIDTNKAAPSYQEIRDALKLTSHSAVHRLVTGLITRGALVKHGRSPRSLTLVTEPRGMLSMQLQARLTRYCAAHREDFDAALADAVTLFLDERERDLGHYSDTEAATEAALAGGR